MSGATRRLGWGRSARRLPMILAAAAVGLGCDTISGVQGTQVPNAPPETQVTGAPPQLDRASAVAEFAWAGVDPDGRIVRFEWRISDNGADNRVDHADTAGLAWHATHASDSLFVVPADMDSFAVDVTDPRQGPADYRFWQTHTFFVRAVDDQGARDPTPASVSFTATTLAPSVEIEIPRVVTSNTCVSSGRVLTFRWSGTDTDGTTGEPAAVRYLFHQLPGCMTQLEFERAGALSSVPDSAWSPWIPYDAPADSGRRVTLPRQDPQRAFIFALQAVDEAGAVTPTFDWGFNLRHVLITSTNAPFLSVLDPLLGRYQFAAVGRVVSVEIAAGQPLEFEWTADANSYAGVIEAYRYGWGVADANDPDDPGWAVSWGDGPLFRRSPSRSFTSGNPNFVVQVRDNSGTISRGVFQLDVIAVGQRDQLRNLLLVSDWPRGTGSFETARDRDWDLRWELLLTAAVPGYDSGLDVVDTHDEPTGFSFRRVNQYKSVIYFAKGGDPQTRFHQLLAPVSRSEPRYNWFEVYQAQVGNVLMCGPLVMYSTFEVEPNVTWKYPIVFNVPEDGEAGFGIERLDDGSVVNRGTHRYPYTAFCLEAVDHVRPPPARIYGEASGAGNQRRSRECDSISRIVADLDFLDEYPSAIGAINSLTPTTERSTLFSQNYGSFQFDREEFYNANRTSRAVSLNPRPCQRTMFRMVTRRAAGWVAGGDTLCPPNGSAQSLLENAPVGIASTAHAQTRPLAGTEDFLWGFHPLALEREPVRRALQWIVRERWQITSP